MQGQQCIVNIAWAINGLTHGFGGRTGNIYMYIYMQMHPQKPWVNLYVYKKCIHVRVGCNDVMRNYGYSDTDEKVQSIRIPLTCNRSPGTPQSWIVTYSVSIVVMATATCHSTYSANREYHNSCSITSLRIKLIYRFSIQLTVVHPMI